MFKSRGFSCKQAGVIGALALAGLLASAPTLAEQTQSTGAGTLSTTARVDFQVNVARFCQLRVGSTGGTIDLVTFDLTGANIAGAGGTVNATTNGTLAVRVASNTASNPTMTVTTTGDLSDGGTNTIPWSKITTSPTSTTGTILAPVLTTGATSTSVTITRGAGNVADGTFTYTLTNDTVYPAGTYGGVNTNNGRVTYTLSCT